MFACELLPKTHFVLGGHSHQSQRCLRKASPLLQVPKMGQTRHVHNELHLFSLVTIHGVCGNLVQLYTAPF